MGLLTEAELGFCFVTMIPIAWERFSPSFHSVLIKVYFIFSLMMDLSFFFTLCTMSIVDGCFCSDVSQISKAGD